uniref:Uncharacterized protein n=1 Tax=Setaria viridis TaxID=4556 RepID=A0A4U6UML7_SETVI|nr:hypothetical protein SEVIR_5G384500v2 [Setaria viridis]
MAAARAPGRRLDTPGVLRRRCAGPGVPRRSHMARLAGCLGARIWDAHPAPQLLFFRSAVAHRRVGSSFPSSMLLLSTIGRRHDGHKAVRV